MGQGALTRQETNTVSDANKKTAGLGPFGPSLDFFQNLVTGAAQAHCHQFTGDRQAVRQQAVAAALSHLCEALDAIST